MGASFTESLFYCSVGCSVFPARRSRAWGRRGRTARRELSAPRGLPGRLRMRAPLVIPEALPATPVTMPQTPRLRAA